MANKENKEQETKKPKLTYSEILDAQRESELYSIPTAEVKISEFTTKDIIRYLSEEGYIVFDAEEDQQLTDYLEQRDYTCIHHEGKDENAAIVEHLEAITERVYPNAAVGSWESKITRQAYRVQEMGNLPVVDVNFTGCNPDLDLVEVLTEVLNKFGINRVVNELTYLNVKSI